MAFVSSNDMHSMLGWVKKAKQNAALLFYLEDID